MHVCKKSRAKSISTTRETHEESGERSMVWWSLSTRRRSARSPTRGCGCVTREAQQMKGHEVCTPRQLQGRRSHEVGQNLHAHDAAAGANAQIVQPSLCTVLPQLLKRRLVSDVARRGIALRSQS